MTREKIIEVILKHVKANIEGVNVEDLDFDKSMKDYGADSLDLVEIVLGTTRDLRLEIESEDYGRVKTINQLVDILLSYAERAEAQAAS